TSSSKHIKPLYHLIYCMSNQFRAFLEAIEKQGSLSRIPQKTGDYLEKKLEELISFEQRKKYGQFSTPLPIARFMALWGIKTGMTKAVLDPAVGCGILIRQLLEQRSEEDTPRRVLCFDIDPLMIKAAHYALDDKYTNIEFQQKDFLLSTPCEEFDFVIANPPYIKSNRMALKERYHDLIEQHYGLRMDGTTGSHIFFLFHAFRYLKAEGRLAFILPAGFLNAGYGEIAKDFLLRQVTLHALIYFDFSDFVFSDGMASALIILATKHPPSKNHKIKFVRLNKWTNENEILFEVLKKPDESGKDKRIKIIPLKDLRAEEKWLSIFQEGLTTSTEYQGFIRLRELARVKRGIATGANEFFTLSKEDVDRWRINKKYLVPVLSKANYAIPPVFTGDDFKELVLKGKKTYLLNITEKNPKGEITKYLMHGKEKKIDQRYLTRHRSRWFFIEKRTPAPVLCKVFNRGEIQFILNETNCLHLTSFHGVYPHYSDYRILKGLILFLSSEIGKKKIMQNLRIYGGGLKKMEPRDVENVQIPDFSLCSNDELIKLEMFFEKWRELKKKTSSMTLQIEDYLRQILERLTERKNNNS
ncbi:MAG: class I SAM-dependent DNA methyltransferase, partial [Promethearchaeota archaeon]